VQVATLVHLEGTSTRGYSLEAAVPISLAATLVEERPAKYTLRSMSFKAQQTGPWAQPRSSETWSSAAAETSSARPVSNRLRSSLTVPGLHSEKHLASSLLPEPKRISTDDSY
jgi:hypothetical protein